VEAQSALLKSIEEPSQGVAYVITATQEEKVLPSILSRGKVIYLARPEINEYKKTAADFFSNSPGVKLKIISKIKKREAAVEFLKKIIAGGHSLMLRNPQLSMAIDCAESALVAINANGNVQLQLTNFVIRLRDI